MNPRGNAYRWLVSGLFVLAPTAPATMTPSGVPRGPLPDCVKPLAEAATAPSWRVVERVGLVGKKRDAFHAELDAKYGKGNWELRHVYRGKLLTPDEAIALYENSYVEYFRKNPKVLDELVKRARDVYDTAPTNVNSGTDYRKQETASAHLQDIAVRRAVERLGRKFEGTELLQMRGPETPLYALTPGFIPFVDPGAILSEPRLYGADWIHAGSIEDFWQNNKFLVVKAR